MRLWLEDDEAREELEHFQFSTRLDRDQLTLIGRIPLAAVMDWNMERMADGGDSMTLWDVLCDQAVEKGDTWLAREFNWTVLQAQSGLERTDFEAWLQREGVDVEAGPTGLIYMVVTVSLPRLRHPREPLALPRTGWSQQVKPEPADTRDIRNVRVQAPNLDRAELDALAARVRAMLRAQGLNVVEPPHRRAEE